MNTVVSDTQTVPETGAYSGKELMFTMVQSSPIQAPIILRNAGANQINYVFQEQINGVWTDMDTVGNPLNNVLAVGLPQGLVVVTVESNYSQVRLLANATGGSTLEFTITRWVNRGSNGSVPILSLG